MYQKDVNKMIEIIEQKIFELEEMNEKYGGHAQILVAQVDILTELENDVKEIFKYKS